MRVISEIFPGEYGKESLTLQFRSHAVSESAHMGLGEWDLGTDRGVVNVTAEPSSKLRYRKRSVFSKSPVKFYLAHKYTTIIAPRLSR